MVIRYVTTTHEALDVTFDCIGEGHLEVVVMVLFVAFTPCAVPESAGVVVEDIVEASLSWICEGTAELTGGGDEPSASLSDVLVVLCLGDCCFCLSNKVLEHRNEELVVLDWCIFVDKFLHFFVADRLEYPLTCASIGNPSDDVACIASTTIVSVAVQEGIASTCAGLHGNDNLAVFSALDEFELHFRLAVCSKGCLRALGACGHDSVCGNVHHLDESCLDIVGHLPEVATVGTIDICPHCLAFECGVHCFSGVYRDCFCLWIAVVVKFASVDGYCLCPFHRVDDAVVAVCDGEFYE